MIKALALTGPTASGKTSLSIKIAKLLGCEIISLDSMQIYKYMDIGTAKATEEERAEVAHHMIDFLSPLEDFSAKTYKDMAMRCAEEIYARGKTPLFVGGTGLYLSTLLRPDCEEAPESDKAYRQRIENTLCDEAARIALFERLKKVDPESAATLHYNNTRRVIRALEIYDKTGKTKSYFDMLSRAKNDKISVTHVTLDCHERDNLYKRADMRVDEMIDMGLVNEVEALLSKGYLSAECTAAQAIGYKEMIGVVLGGEDLLNATERLKQATRNYAKRQLTWFRHMDGVRTVYIDTPEGVMRSFDDILGECVDIFKNAN